MITKLIIAITILELQGNGGCVALPGRCLILSLFILLLSLFVLLL